MRNNHQDCHVDKLLYKNIGHPISGIEYRIATTTSVLCPSTCPYRSRDGGPVSGTDLVGVIKSVIKSVPIICK